MTQDTDITDPTRQGLDPDEVWTDEYVREELWANVYGEPLPPDATPGPEDLRRKEDRLLAFLATTCDDILDVGCGWMDYAVPEGVTVTGAEQSPAMRRLAEAVHPDRRIVAANVLDLPFDDGAFEGVRSSALLRHVEGWEAALAELVRVADDRLAFTHLTADTPHKCGPYQWCTTPRHVIQALPDGIGVDVSTYKAKEHRRFESTLFEVQL